MAFSNLKIKVYKLITFLKGLQVFKHEWQESPAGTRQTDGKNLVWFGELERKLAKSSKTTFTYRSSSSLFYGAHCMSEPIPIQYTMYCASGRGRGRYLYHALCIGADTLIKKKIRLSSYIGKFRVEQFQSHI